ncbi:hypothetical protein AK830_g6512 [Neonectria ditissima]|uniref:Protein bir1 n=1 Tax=Neonectria ditissima TaxID=78410 RepID=A0A0N8H6V7_9HYPO|nr:hypothetical protein AK830_g6512 [Neonectria ditissima]
MSAEEITDEYIAYENRLASFHKSVKKRASGTNGRGTKNLSWPHRNIAPASLARAGFFYNPSPTSPDNVTCFLCHKGLDGWEAGDDPLLEHLKHGPDCGWALVAAIEAELGDYAQEDPSQPYMKEARKATFAGRWPHDSKKGWKCKTKQLVDAGWKYTPTTDSDDMATCVYCQLALDGWEPADKPLDEHYNRSPDCPFFALLEQTQGAKKTSRAKTNRASKASRLSVQSVATATSEAASITDSIIGPEDSVLTTASTQGGKKSKARKTATGKGRKTKAKKEEAVEEVETEVKEEEAPPPQKPARGKKRASTAMDDSAMTTEAPAPKKRVLGNRSSPIIDSSVVGSEDDEMMDAPAPKKVVGRKKVHASTTKVRKASTASVTSAASATSVPGAFPDDDEIERQLEADLERHHSDDEEITVDSDSERMNASRSKRDHNSTTEAEPAQESAEYAMFNPTPVEHDDAEVEDELKALQAEMEIEEPQELHVPKKGRKAGVRKTSKQTKTKKAKVPTPEPVEEEEEAPAPPQEIEEEVHEDSLASTGTVVIKTTAESRLSTGKRGRGRPSKASLASRESTGAVELVEPPTESPADPPSKAATEAVAQPPVKRGRGRPSKASLASRASTDADNAQPTEAPPKRGRGRPSKKSIEARLSTTATSSQESVEVVKKDPEVQSAGVEKNKAPVVSFEEPQQSPVVRDMASSPPPSTRHLANPPSTPGRVISPAPSARQAAISPSQSPQSSDAENQPPSSKPAASVKRVALAPVVATPTRGSPSKRNVIAGLRSTTAWTEVDVEAVLASPLPKSGKENGVVDRLLKQGKTLTSPEKQMTVEEWIYHNAGEAEKKLKQECEAMVSRFESEGSKAMRVLEGLVVE